MEKEDQNDDVMTQREVADWLQVHEMTVYRLIRAEKIPAFRVGGLWRLSRKKVAAHYNLDIGPDGKLNGNKKAK